MPIYVQHEVLGQIPDVFNAEAIWQAPGFSLFSRRTLLRDLLERSPREQRGRAATRCFSHITLRLPQDDVDDDYHLTRGSRARELAETLTSLHQKDFGDLLGSDQVRYGVAGAEDLAPGQIEVCFGHAVYLPAPDEKALFNVSVSRDSAVWKPVCAVYPDQRLALIGGIDGASVAAPGWPFGDEGAILLVNDGPDNEPVVQMRPKDAFDCQFDASLGAYAIRSKRAAGERFLLKITRAAGAPRAAQRAPVFAPDAATIRVPSASAAAGLGRDAGADIASGIGVGAVPGRAAAPGAGIGVGNASGVGAGFDAAGAGVAIGSRGGRPAVWQARAAQPLAAYDPQQQQQTSLRPHPAGLASTLAEELTAVPMPAAALRPRFGESDATFAPGALQRLSLVALALPRLSRYRNTGAIALEIPFTPTLAIARSAQAERSITFVTTENDDLYAVTAAGRQRITAPASFSPNGGRSLRLHAAPQQMAERYSALLTLAEACSQPLIPGARTTFGRSVAQTATLRPLDSPWMLASTSATSSANGNGGSNHSAENAENTGSARRTGSAEGVRNTSSPDRIGLSRTAFAFESAADGLQVTRQSSTQALYHLDDKLQFVAAISDDKPYAIPPGHHIVAGHYVLRFDA